MPTTTPTPHAQASGTPQRGDRFLCKACGMAIEITADCRCNDPKHVRFECCNQPMAKA